MLLWREDVAKIITGMAIGPGQNRKHMIDGLLKGTPRTLFDSAVDIHANQRRTTRAAGAPDDQARLRIEAETLVQNYTNNVIDLAIKQMLTQLMPRRILASSKRYLRRECRKPRDMKVKIYYQHLVRYIGQELTNLPPFGPNQGLGEDEVLDIVLYATPKSWQREMDKQGFDPLEHNLDEVIDFMERIEASEDFDSSKDTKTKDKPNTQKGGKSNGKGKPRGNASYYCIGLSVDRGSGVAFHILQYLASS